MPLPQEEIAPSTAPFNFPNVHDLLGEEMPAVDEEAEFVDEMEEEAEEAVDAKFYENLAENLESRALDAISSYLFEAIEDDAVARDAMTETADKVLKYAGMESIEDLVGDQGAKVVPNTLRTFDSTFQTCLTRNFADIFPQIYPLLGPAGYYINGERDQWGEIDDAAAMGRDFMNWYLTVKDTEYYSDAGKSVINTIFYGTGFKKIYYDPESSALSRFISPRKFIINSECDSILESSRLTHELDLSKKDILQKMETGVYKKVDLFYLKGLTGDEADPITPSTPGSQAEDASSKTYRGQFPFYECHTYLNLKDFTEAKVDKHSEDVPLPYVVTLDKTTKKIVSLRRNWKIDDEKHKRIEIFEVINYIKGFGIYGRGLIHLIGSNAITLTKILRALVNAAIYQNLPSAFISKGILKNPDKAIALGPGELYPVEAIGDLRASVMPLPFNGPSPALLELYRSLIDQTKELGGIADMGLTETKDNVSPMTAVGVMDHVAKIQSAAVQSFHASLSRELQMMWKILKETTEYQEFTFGQKARVIRKEDFIDEVSIVPVSAPEMNSRTQRVMKVQALQSVSEQFQGLFKPEVIARQMLDAMGMNAQEIDNVMFTPEELQQKSEGQQPPIDPNQLTLADIQQRAAEVEARIKIAEGQQAATIFKTETDLQIAAAKLKMDMEASERKEQEVELKARLDQELQVMKEEMAANSRRSEQELTKLKLDLEKYKADLNLEQTELKIEADKEIAEFNASVNLIQKEIEHGTNNESRLEY